MTRLFLALLLVCLAGPALAQISRPLGPTAGVSVPSGDDQIAYANTGSTAFISDSNFSRDPVTEDIKVVSTTAAANEGLNGLTQFDNSVAGYTGTLTPASNSLVFHVSSFLEVDVWWYRDDAGNDHRVAEGGTVVNEAGNELLTLIELRGSLHVATGTGSIFTLPTAALGLHGCFLNKGTGTLSVKPSSGDFFYLSGTASALDPEDKISSTSAHSTVCIRAVSTSEWMMETALGTWTDGGA